MDTTQDPDRRVEDARASLLARVEELGKRIDDIKDKLDIRAKIAAHPRAAVGIAFALGMLAGIPGGGGKRKTVGETKAEVKGGLIGAVAATIGSLMFTLVKSVAINHLSDNARTWWMNRMEADASRTHDVESFLEH